MLQDGRFRCISCRPTIEVKADGEDHSVKGQRMTRLASKLWTITQFAKSKRKMARTSAMKSSQFLVMEYSDRRVRELEINHDENAKAPAGAHALSGSWQPLKMESISDRELLVTYKLEGEVFSMSRPTGQSYTAKLDGTDAPYKGDPDANGVAVKRISKTCSRKPAKLNGKAVSLARLTVALRWQVHDCLSKDLPAGSTNEFTMRKQ